VVTEALEGDAALAGLVALAGVTALEEAVFLEDPNFLGMVAGADLTGAAFSAAAA